MSDSVNKHIIQVHNLKSVLDQGFLGTLPTELKINQIAIAQSGSDYRLMYRDNAGAPHYTVNVGDTGVQGPMVNFISVDNASGITGPHTSPTSWIYCVKDGVTGVIGFYALT